MENNITVSKEFMGDDWDHAIKRSSEYIIRKSGREFSLSDLLRNLDDERFLSLGSNATKLFLSDLHKKIPFTLKGDLSNLFDCKLNYAQDMQIRKCREALARGERMEEIAGRLVKEESVEPFLAGAAVGIAAEFEKLSRIRRCIGFIKVYTASKRGRKPGIETIEKKLKQEGFMEEEIAVSMERMKGKMLLRG